MLYACHAVCPDVYMVWGMWKLAPTAACPVRLAAAWLLVVLTISKTRWMGLEVKDS